jgi:hypothetical protein
MQTNTISFQGQLYDILGKYGSSDYVIPNTLVGFVREMPSITSSTGPVYVMDLGWVVKRELSGFYLVTNASRHEFEVPEIWHVQLHMGQYPPVPVPDPYAYNHPPNYSNRHTKVDADDCCLLCCMTGLVCCDD